MGIKYVVGAFVLASYLGGCTAMQKEFGAGFSEIGRDVKSMLELDVDQDGKTTFERNCEKTREGLWNIMAG